MGYMDYFLGMGLAPWAIAVMALVMIWDIIWKLLAMWKASKKHSAIWFILLFLFNTAGILPILYIYVFSEMKLKKTKKTATPRRKKRK